MTLGQKIRHTRLQKGLSQKKLALMTDVTKASISNYERDLRTPQAPVLYNLANILEIPLSDLNDYLSESPDDKKSTDDTVSYNYPVHARTLLRNCEHLSNEGWLRLIQISEEFRYIPKYRK